jgi:hypothetical protein
MKIWMFNCREVSMRVSQSMDKELSLSQKLGVRLHLMMCCYCARFGRQLTMIRRVMHGEKDSLQHQKMDERTKEKLRKIMKECQKH